MRIKNLLAAIGLTIFTFNASAALITKTFEADVFNTYRTDVVNIGDSISWSLTYDDASTSYTVFKDGVDGLGGTSDDTVDFVSNCTGSCQLKSNFTFINFSLIDQVVAGILGEGSTLYDFNNQNFAYVRLTSSGTQNYVFAQDFISMNASIYSTSSYGSLTVNSRTSAGALSTKQITFNNIREVTGSVAVPEPSGLSVFGLAGLLLAGRRFSRK